MLLPDVVVLSDKPCLAQMIDAYDELGGNVIAVNEVPHEHTNRYGILKPGKEATGAWGSAVEVLGLVEKPKPEDAPSNLSVTGRYILPGEVFDHLSRQEAGAGGEIQLTDAMLRLVGKQPFMDTSSKGRRSTAATRLASSKPTSRSR